MEGSGFKTAAVRSVGRAALAIVEIVLIAAVVEPVAAQAQLRRARKLLYELRAKAGRPFGHLNRPVLKPERRAVAQLAIFDVRVARRSEQGQLRNGPQGQLRFKPAASQLAHIFDQRKQTEIGVGNRHHFLEILVVVAERREVQAQSAVEPLELRTRFVGSDGFRIDRLHRAGIVRAPVEPA